jgi:hypothetical protein
MSGGLEAMKAAEGLAWDASSFYLTRSMTGDHGGFVGHTSPSSALRPLSTIDRASPPDLPQPYHLYPGRLVAHSSLWSVGVCDNMLSKGSYYHATAGQREGTGCSITSWLRTSPCMDLDLLWPVALWFHDARLRGSGPLGKVGQVR